MSKAALAVSGDPDKFDPQCVTFDPPDPRYGDDERLVMFGQCDPHRQIGAFCDGRLAINATSAPGQIVRVPHAVRRVCGEGCDQTTDGSRLSLLRDQREHPHEVITDSTAGSRTGFCQSSRSVMVLNLPEKSRIS
jgi:hypothetical protein